MKIINRCLGLVLIIDAVICPLLILWGCYLWTYSGQMIEQRWSEFTVAARDNAAHAAVVPPNGPATVTPHPSSSQSQTVTPSVNTTPINNSTPPGWGVPQVMQEAWLKLDSGLSKMSQALDDGLFDLKQVLVHTAAWQSLVKLQIVLIAVIELIGTYIYLIIGFLCWRLLKVAQLIRACCFVIHGEIPEHIKALLTD